MTDTSRVEWDENKRQKNIDKHYIDFADVIPLFDSTYMSEPSIRDGERRHKSIGEINGSVIVVIHTERDGCKRIISARKAHQNERDDYKDHIAKITQR